MGQFRNKSLFVRFLAGQHLCAWQGLMLISSKSDTVNLNVRRWAGKPPPTFHHPPQATHHNALSGIRNDLCNELKKMKVVHFHILIALLS